MNSLHHVLFFPFRIAIWNRKIFVSSLVVGAWLAGTAVNIYGMFGAPQLCAPYSHLVCLHLRRLDNGAAFVRVLSELLDSCIHNQKLEPSYNAVLDICIISDLQKSRVNIVGMIVVDILLLASMLIGLLQHAHRSSTGVWFLLYQQVIPFPLQYLAWEADIPQVHHLDSVSDRCRGASCGQFLSVA